ncbi:thyroid adenoma-associated protein [Hylaeus volcanicus]|uniref:thyroid adenoma-associated protein n=1 Tax=Hylaeus volcanicus TaxID=313075 RepID=UPI0023B854C4|nr:thyroid adenoma-associated protein [Hylaeus volcanicus]
MFTQREIKQQLKELLALKRSGELDTDEKPTDDHFWRDSITYDSLERYVQHHDEEIKLDTLTLIVESKKSTLRFTSRELDLIILFLRVNFKEKLEFVPGIKKALKRMKDSLVVMRRQCIQEEKMRNHNQKNCNPLEIKQEVLDQSYKISYELERNINMYHNTFQSLHNMCICSPDATYCRRRSSLQILLLMTNLLDEEYKHITWKTQQTKALFDLLLLDTYEANKEMAFKLMKSVDPKLLQLDDENNTHNIIMVAIQLGNSIRPIDSITAAYMLKISMLSPVIQNVLDIPLDLMKQSDNKVEAIILELILILLNTLKKSLILAKENIVMTVTKHSLYGYLFCIRSLLHECDLKKVENKALWKDTISELICVCFEFSCVVSLIVNNSSPEGHLPMDLNLQTVRALCGSSSEKQVVTPQMVLLCSWRTVKEVSLLFGFLATKAPICEEDSSLGLLNKEQIIKIGEHLVTLLTETKHRGAFEQAHVGFSQLCTRLWRLNNESLNQLPKMWLHQILNAISGMKEENSKLCATRRSAGVPFMIQAILSTEPRQHKDTKTTIFDSVMKILLGFTELQNINLWKEIKELMYRDSAFLEYENTFESLRFNNDHCINKNSIQVTEIKTHALNILRAIFRHSQLAEIVNNYVEDGLIAAFKSYDALTWTERNAATLLFSALIIRIFGVQRTKDHINLTTDNKMNYKLFFEKYPRLLSFITNELQTFVTVNDSIIKSNVQSILLLLSRLYYSQSSELNDIQCQIDDLITLVMQCAKSKVYETRKLAARALVALLTEQSAGSVLIRLIENVISAEKTHPSLNLMHGYMLQIYEVLKRFNLEQCQSFNVDWDRFLKRTSWILENLERVNSNPPCFLLAAVYINICNEVCKVDETYMKQHASMFYVLASHLVENDKLKQGPAREEYKLSVIIFLRFITRETSLIRPCIPIRVYLDGLRDLETQITAWSTFMDIIDEITYNDVSMQLLNYAVEIIFISIQDLARYNPELQDAMFNFLYNCLIHRNQFDSGCMKTIDICKFVVNEVRLNDNKDSYCERDTYLRLLGKSYVTLASFNDAAEEINLECINDVYDNFCDNFWIASLNADFRASVLQIMQDLFLACCKRDEYRYVQIQWWTTILQLLVDNNSQVRHEAFKLLQYIPIHCPLSNEFSYLHLLLAKFYEFIHEKDPELFCIVVFYWGISLLDDTNYEMDETDVFNKCTNYDFYEPVETSRICAKFLMEHMSDYVDNVLSDDIVEWINSRLNVEISKSISFKTFVNKYECYVPTVENRLDDILDPTYKNKLLRVRAYREFKDIL